MILNKHLSAEII